MIFFEGIIVNFSVREFSDFEKKVGKNESNQKKWYETFEYKHDSEKNCQSK